MPRERFENRNLPNSNQQEYIMAASIPIEIEQCTFTCTVHHHNGYHAGDFSQIPINVLPPAAFRPV